MNRGIIHVSNSVSDLSMLMIRKVGQTSVPTILLCNARSCLRQLVSRCKAPLSELFVLLVCITSTHKLENRLRLLLSVRSNGPLVPIRLCICLSSVW